MSDPRVSFSVACETQEEEASLQKESQGIARNIARPLQCSPTHMAQQHVRRLYAATIAQNTGKHFHKWLEHHHMALAPELKSHIVQCVMTTKIAQVMRLPSKSYPSYTYVIQRIMQHLTRTHPEFDEAHEELRANALTRKISTSKWDQTWATLCGELGWH